MSEINLTKTSALSVDQLAVAAPHLINLYKSAEVVLKDRDLIGERGPVYLVLDRSGSTRPFYRDGSLQRFAEQTLGLAAHLDDDGVVPVVFFSTEVHTHGALRRKKTFDVSLDNYKGRIEAIHEGLGHMGTTNYADAMKAVIEHYQASGSTDPAFVAFLTDGAPTDRAATTALIKSSSRLPIFWQFVGFGEDPFTFLRSLDEMPVPQQRVIDNAGFFAAGANPKAMTDDALYRLLLGEYPQWLRAAREQGIVA
ncbi:VWA domain-containing protein [Streptacidiphilus sp. EB103A]|uniref:VWA domain-containing protein n=1 Tax=Streptacidiphilus sp. EB103A TaxID=3156275 RepID=UPI0035185B1B